MVEEYDEYEYDEPEQYDSDYEEDLAEDQIEDQSDLQEEMMEDLAPSPQKKEDLYSLFWKVLRIKDSSKVGNLSKEELGMFDIPVRELMKIRLLSYSLGHKYFGDYFSHQAEIILSTSASKEGWLPELFVSNKQVKTKTRKYNVDNLRNQSQPKKKLFKWGK